MDAVRRDEEKIIQGLAVAMCLAMVGVVVFPTITGNVTAVYAYVSGKKYGSIFSLWWTVYGYRTYETQ